MDIKNIKMQSSVLTNMSSSGGKNNNKNYQVKDSGEKKKQTSYTVHKDEKNYGFWPINNQTMQKYPCC